MNRYVCVRCGETNRYYAPAQRHAYEQKHPRIEIKAGSDD